MLEQMDIRLTTEKLYSEASQTIMRNMGYKPGQGLGTKGQGDPDPPSIGGQGFS